MHPYLNICTYILVRNKFLAIMSIFNDIFMSFFYFRQFRLYVEQAGAELGLAQLNMGLSILIQ